MSEHQLGISVVICCHNSAPRLCQTLSHLAAQELADRDIPWEVIVIDNGSTDQTAALAINQWPVEGNAPMRVVNEPEPGLIHARIRGFNEAQFELVSFIDDDNWVCQKWIQTVSEVMSQHPRIGACGAWSVAVSDSKLPCWFNKYSTSYSVGEQGSQHEKESGDVTLTRGYLWGAGLTIRKSAWQQLIEAGFYPALLGRQGVALSSGEDAEICYALRLAGWRLWYDRRLKLRHFIPAERLEWCYLRQLHQGVGAAFVVLGLYLQALQPTAGLLGHLKQIWLFQTIGAGGRFVLRLVQWRLVQWGLPWLNPSEAEKALLESDYYKGKLVALLRQRRDYATLVARIQTLAGRLKKAHKGQSTDRRYECPTAEMPLGLNEHTHL